MRMVPIRALIKDNYPHHDNPIKLRTRFEDGRKRVREKYGYE